MEDLKPLGRFKGIKAAELTAEQRSVLDVLSEGRGAIPSPYRFLIQAPHVAVHYATLGTDLRKKAKLTGRELETVILATAGHLESEFVEAAHRRAGAKVGLSQEIMDAVVAHKPAPFTDPREQAVYALALALHHSVPVSDADAAAAETALGNEMICEIIGLIGSYTQTCYVMRFVGARASEVRG